MMMCMMWCAALKLVGNTNSNVWTKVLQGFVCCFEVAVGCGDCHSAGGKPYDGL